MDDRSLQQRVEALAAGPERSASSLQLLAEVRQALGNGSLRVAEPNGQDDSGAPQWKVNLWVKQALLLMPRLGLMELRDDLPVTGELDTLPWRTQTPSRCRVPHGSSLRHGCYLAPGVECLPPSVIQIGSYIAPHTTIDSFVNIGIAAQIGAGVQLSARTTVGGWLLPLAATPTIVEDGVLMGVGSGVFDGARIGTGAILLAGTRIVPSLGLYDLETDALLPATPGTPLRVPPFAIVAMGSRTLTSGLALEMPLIVGRRAGSGPAEWQSFTGVRFDSPQ